MKTRTRKMLAILLTMAMLLSMLGMVACGNSGEASVEPAAVAAASGDASGDASGNAGFGGPGGPGGGAGSKGQEFGTFDEVQSYAAVIIDGSEIKKVDTDAIEGTVSDTGMDGATINVTEGNGIAITKPSETDVYTIKNSKISVTSGSINNDLGYEAAAGVAVGVNTGELHIEDSTIQSDGPRSTPVYLFSNQSPEATSLVVVNSTLQAHSDEIWMPPFKLLMGGARATLLMTRNNSWFYGSDMLSNNWGAISQDTVDAYSYVINSKGLSTDGGYATYLTYGMRLYGSVLAAGQYGVFMCGDTDFISDTGAAALEDATAMSKVPDFAVDTEAKSLVAAPYNAIVVHNSLPALDMVSKAVFNNTVVSTLVEDLPDGVNAIAYNDDFFMPGVDILGSGAGCGASYFYNKNLYGSLALVRSMNAELTFNNSDLRSSNGVLVQSVVTYDPPMASGYLAVGEGETLPGITTTFVNGKYTGDVLHQDYQRKMAIIVGDKAVLEGKIVSGTYAAWNELWSEKSLVAALESDGYSADFFNNDNWVEDVHTNLIRTDDTDYAASENLGVDVTVAAGGEWVVTDTSSLNSLTIEAGASVTAPAGKTLVVYENCDASNAKLAYDESTGKEVAELAAGSYQNVVIVVK